MAGVCTNSVRDSGAGCDHRTVTVDLDGNAVVNRFVGADLDALSWSDPLPNEWLGLTLRQAFARLGTKYARDKGATFDALVGRVCNGEEATNVKQYFLLAKDVTKTNIGTSYVNVPPGLNGERSLVEFTGCTEFRIVLNMNAVGTGPWGARVVRDSDNAVLFENANITGAGEKELDTDWQPLPAAASGLALVRLQGKSTVGADDPVFRRAVMLVR